MKILMAGMSTLQAGTHRTLTTDFNIADGLRIALQVGGHTVDRPRVISPFEELDKYDAVIVGLSTLTAITTKTRLAGALATIHRCREDKIPMAFMVDDWDVVRLVKSIELAAKGSNTFRGVAARLGMPFGDYFEEHFDDVILPAVQFLKDGPWPMTAMTMFKAPDSARTLLTSYLPVMWLEQLWAVDIADLVMPSNTWVPDAEAKRKIVVNAGFTDQTKWVEGLRPYVRLPWSLEEYGGKRLGVSGSKAPNSVVKEPDLLEVYRQSWCVTCPPYYHSGAGWQRPRIVQAAAMGSILVAEPREMEWLLQGAAYGMEGLSAYGFFCQLRNMSTKDLSLRARNQRDGLQAALTHRWDTIYQVNETMSKIVKGEL